MQSTPEFEKHLAGEVADRVAARRAAFLRDWGEWQPRTLAQHTEFGAARWGDRARFISDGRAWSYAEVAEYMDRAAAAFHRAGVGPGDRVGLLLRNCAEFFALKFALTRIGAIALPLNYLLSTDELAYILGSAAPVIVVTDAEIQNREMVPVVTEAMKEAGEVALVVRGVAAPGRGGVAYDDFIASGQGITVTDVGDPSLAAELMYTAGSTGFPKGVLLTNDALVRASFATCYTRALKSDVCSVTALPPFHLFGFAQAVQPPSYVGGCVHLQAKFDPIEQIELVADGGVNDVIGVRAMLYRIFDLVDAGELSAAPIRSAFIAGDVVPEADWQRLRDEFGVDEITSGFGMTEVQGTSFLTPPGSSNEILSNTIGWESNGAVAGLPEMSGAMHEWRIASLTTGEPVELGQVGELQYRGPSVSPGYWGVAADEDPSRVGGWFKSGDLAWQREDGAVVFRGRNSETFRSGGELVTPREVESVLGTMPGVASAHVVGVPDRMWGQVGFAWLILDGSHAPDQDEVVAYCKERLAKYKVPKYVSTIVESELPVTGSGKLNKRALAQRAAERIAPVAG